VVVVAGAVVATHPYLPILGAGELDEARAMDQDVLTANQGSLPTAETPITPALFREGIEKIAQEAEMVL
jgi:hypothetical protein